MYCSKCGQQQTEGTAFCSNCGEKLNSEPTQNPEKDNPVQPTEPNIPSPPSPITRPNNPETADPKKLEKDLLAALVGTKQEYYLPAFEKVEQGTKKFNWVAFFFAPALLIYRKCYREFFIYFAIYFGLPFINAMLLSYNLTSFNFGASIASIIISVILSIVAIAFCIYLGLSFNRIYYQHLKDIIQKDHLLTNNYAPSIISKKGGVSGVNVLLAFLGTLILSFILSFIISTIFFAGFATNEYLEDEWNTYSLSEEIPISTSSGTEITLEETTDSTTSQKSLEIEESQPEETPAATLKPVQPEYYEPDYYQYYTVIDAVYADYGEYCYYYLYDLDQNGIVELITSQGTCNADWFNEVYTFNDGQLDYLGYYYNPVSYYIAEDGDGLYAVSGTQMVQTIQQITLHDGWLKAEEIMRGEVSEYYYNAYPIEGCFVTDYSLMDILLSI